ncbi:MAG: hypothetical protein Q7T44_09080 [Parvibaculum sp.]|nr:hypothetical protein [Parvibaculum sp.]
MQRSSVGSSSVTKRRVDGNPPAGIGAGHLENKLIPVAKMHFSDDEAEILSPLMSLRLLGEIRFNPHLAKSKEIPYIGIIPTGKVQP